MKSSRRELSIDTSDTSNNATTAWFEDKHEISFSSDDSTSKSSSSNSAGSNVSLNSFVSFFPPANINCELENTFAELAKFTEELMYKLGNNCPTNSPMSSPTKLKHSHSLVNSAELLIRIPIASSELVFKNDNRRLIKMNEEAGRNYSRLTTVAKLLIRRIQLMDLKALTKFIDDNNIQCMERTIINLKKLPAIHFIAYLYLADKYPLMADQTFMLIFVAFQQGMNIYECFNKLDGLLKKSTLTKTAMEAHLMVKEGVEKFGIKL